VVAITYPGPGRMWDKSVSPSQKTQCLWGGEGGGVAKNIGSEREEENL